jgi:hypothetical protein
MSYKRQLPYLENYVKKFSKREFNVIIRKITSRIITTGVRDHLKLPMALTIFLYVYLALVQFFGFIEILYPPLVICLFIFTFYLSIRISGISFRSIASSYTMNLQKKRNLLEKTLFHTTQQIFLCLILMLGGYTALFAIPNNWDSMVYHLPRMEHWIQNNSLWFYNTDSDLLADPPGLQPYFPPGRRGLPT